MIGALFKQLFFRPPPGPQGPKLFEPPSSVAERTDSIDEAIAADAEHLTPGKKIVVVGLGVLSSGVIPGQRMEIVHEWGQSDRFDKKKETEGQ